MKKYHKIAIIILVIMGSWMVSGVFFHHNPESDEDIASAPFKVEVIDLGAKEKEQIITAYGFAKANKKVEIKAQTEGLVEEIVIQKGNFAKVGDVIIKIDPKDKYAQMKAAETLAQEKKIIFESAASIGRKGLGSSSKTASAQAEYEKAVADHEKSKQEYENTMIKAPFEGYIEDMNVEIGDYVLSGFAEMVGGNAKGVATMVQANPIKISANIPVSKIAMLKDGMEANLKIANSNKNLPAKLIFVGSAADSATKSFAIELEAQNPDLAVKDGQAVEISIKTGSVIAYQVPSSSIALDDNGEMGIKLVGAENKVDFFPIKIISGSQNDMWVIGKSEDKPLPQHFKLITLGGGYLQNGAEVSF